MTGSFLGEPPLSPEARALYDEDLADGGERPPVAPGT
jgi:hypothetical protein